MRILSAIPLLVFLTLGTAQETTPYPPCYDPSDDACSMTDYDVLTIKCTAGEYPTCTCVPKTKEGDDACTEVNAKLEAAEEANTQMTADSCKDLCVTQSEGEYEKECYFYRWEQHAAVERKFQCTMRSIIEDKPCQSDPCFDETLCVAGHIPCKSEDGTLPTPTPAPADCPGKIHYDSSKIHWRCYTHPPYRSGLGNPNPYMDDTLAPGTTCFTMKKCNAWSGNEGSSDVYEYNLVARCEGSEQIDVNGTKYGTWVADDMTGSVNITNKFIQENKLVEPDLEDDCATKCEDIVLFQDQLDIPGIEVFCTYPLENWTIKDGNSCILLCDQELVTSASCGYNPVDGSKSWKGESGEEVYASTFLCSWMTPPPLSTIPTDEPTDEPTEEPEPTVFNN